MDSKSITVISNIAYVIDIFLMAYIAVRIITKKQIPVFTGWCIIILIIIGKKEVTTVIHTVMNNIKRQTILQPDVQEEL